MNTDRPLQSQQQVALAAEVQALGRLLDSMERGAAPMSARQFRRAALRVAEVLAASEDLNNLRRACTGSAALRELLQNELMQRACKEGSMRWMHSFKF